MDDYPKVWFYLKTERKFFKNTNIYGNIINLKE